MASILMLTPQLPYPPQQGTALRNWGLLQGLAAHHDVALLTFASPDQPTTPAPPLTRHTTQIRIVPQPTRTTGDRLRDLLVTGQPDLIRRLNSAPFRQQVETWLAEAAFDWVMAEGLEMAPYLDVVPAEGTPRPRIIFDAHNCEYLLQRRAARSDWRHPQRWIGALYSSIQWRRLRRYEARVCRRADIVVAVSEADAAALRAVAPTIDPLVIPNGIDVAAYAGYQDAASLAQPAFVFTGTMDFRPNVDGVLWFVDTVWSQIRAHYPGAHFYIVGRHPHTRLDRLRDVPGIVITGAVPDTRPYIRAAAVVVVPLLVGGGTRLKLLESTAMGKAIVATSLAAEGFNKPGHAMVLADTPATFADACIALARDPIARQAWGERAYSFAQAYDWPALMPELITAIDHR